MYLPLQVVAFIALLSCIGHDVLGAPDNRGTEFIIGYMANYALYNPVELYVTTSSAGTVNVHVSAPKYTGITLDQRFTVTAGKVHQIKISNKIRAAGTELSTKGILVTATEEVVVYGTNLEVYSNDAFLGYPTDVLGMEYYTVSHHPSTMECEFMIIGVEDNTLVTIKLGKHSSIEVQESKKVKYYENSVYTKTLGRYDTYQAQTYGDLTGTYITSDKKIVVMSGNRRTSVSPGTSRDTLVDQMLPVDVWGKKFAIVPTPERTTGDNVRFIGAVDNTQVNVVCSGGWTSNFRVNSRSYVLKITPSDENCYVTASEGIMVILIVISQTKSSEPADPALITIPPVEQYGADYTFSTPKYSKGEYKNFFMFIVDASLISGLKLNGAAISAQKVRAIPNTNYVGGYIVVSPGTHTVRHDSPISVFGGFMYGTATYETYGMPLGMRMAPVNTICIPSAVTTGDGLDNDCDGLIDEELCTTENGGKDDDGDGVADEDCATPVPIDGGWTAWSAYTSCSASCTLSSSSSGTKTRTRTCTNPAPKYNGAQCSGSAAQTVTCSTTSPCGVDGGWGSWGSWAGTVTSGSGGTGGTGTGTNTGTVSTTLVGQCSVSCGSGTWSRTRSCDNPAPSNGGAACVGDTVQTDSCISGVSCPVDGGWGSWGPWAGTVSSGSGSSGTTGSTGLVGATTAVPGSGSGTGTGSTSLVGQCSVTCGTGTWSRTRPCDNPPTAHGGTACAGDTVQTEACVTGVDCPIDGGWADWGAWSSCTVTCGSAAITRSRTCSNPAPQYNGNTCVGNNVETSFCSAGSCPIDGGYSDWSLWTTCTVTCGGGTSGRARTCDNPVPAHGGAACSGSSSDSMACGTINCPIDGDWGVWTAWSACGITCGYSTHSRSRTCDNPTPQYNGADCAGSASESQQCYAGIMCPIDGGLTDWTAWDTCTVTCAGGTQGRTRTCTNPTPQYNGAACTGSTSESQACNTQNCPIDGDWTSWDSWSGCSSTCGPGAITRDRTCTNPLPQYGGAGCFGDPQESIWCNGTCTVHGSWGDWGQWTQCTQTCDAGRKGRVRLCNDPAPTPDGNPCIGNAFEISVCAEHSCTHGNGTNGQYVNRCPLGFFTCKSGKITCIREEFSCDCAPDCYDNSDEDTRWATCDPQLQMHCGNTAAGFACNMALLLLLFLLAKWR